MSVMPGVGILDFCQVHLARLSCQGRVSWIPVMFALHVCHAWGRHPWDSGFLVLHVCHVRDRDPGFL